MRGHVAWQRVREINEQPWEPLPGMVKVRCSGCDLLFATPQGEPTEICPDCVFRVQRRQQLERLRLRQQRHMARA